MALTAERFKNEPRFLSVDSGVLPMKLTTPRETGPGVLILQRALIDFLHVTMPGTTTALEGIPDSTFGPETQDAVKCSRKPAG
jgi:hypothetical protein